MTPGRLKVHNLAAGEWQYTPGGSQPWDEHDLSPVVGAWTDDGGGTWTFVDGVISQTDATGDSMLLYNTGLPGTEYVMEAEVRLPTGQDAGTTMFVIVSAGNPDAIAAGNTGSSFITGEGICLSGDAAGDGAGIQTTPWVDGVAAMFPPNALPTSITQGTWHTLRAVVSPIRQFIYIDGVYLIEGETISGGNSPSVPGGEGNSGSVDLPGLGAVGLVDFRNVKVWTPALPA